MQKSVTQLVLQLFMENLIQKVMIPSDGDRLILDKATWQQNLTVIVIQLFKHKVQGNLTASVLEIKTKNFRFSADRKI